MYPSTYESPSYGQLFIVDQKEVTNIQCNQISTLHAEDVGAIDNALHNCNIFAQSYRMMHEELEQSMLNASTENKSEMQFLFSLKPKTDQRRYI